MVRTTLFALTISLLVTSLIISLLLQGCAEQNSEEQVNMGKSALNEEQGVMPQDAAETTAESTKKESLESETNNKVLLIIAQKNFRDEELKKPKGILENNGYEVDVASITTAPARGMLGSIVKPDLAVRNANVEDYSFVGVIGGSGAPSLMGYDEVLELLRTARARGKALGAICLGPMVLAKAGVLQGKQATVFKTPESVAALKASGATFVDKPIVVDGNIVTANSPRMAEAFGNKILEMLESQN